MQISIKSDIDRVAKELPRELRKQIPFATSQALNDTARNIATKSGRRDMDREIDRPKKWTKTGLRYTRSNKRNLTSAVYIAPERWAYLKHIINATTRQPRRKLIAIGAGKRNQYGNKPRGWIGKQSAKGNTFWGEVEGRYGLWQRMSRGKLKLLAYTTPQADYDQSYDYSASVQRGVDRSFNRYFRVRILRAIKSAK